jgi:hypothetical protein
VDLMSLLPSCDLHLAHDPDYLPGDSNGLRGLVLAGILSAMNYGVALAVTGRQALPEVTGLPEQRPIRDEVHPGAHLVTQLEIQALEEVAGLAPLVQ